MMSQRWPPQEQRRRKKVCTSGALLHFPVIATNEQQNMARLFFLAKEFRTLLIHGLNNSQQHAKTQENKTKRKAREATVGNDKSTVQKGKKKITRKPPPVAAGI